MGFIATLMQKICTYFVFGISRLLWRCVVVGGVINGTGMVSIGANLKQGAAEMFISTLMKEESLYLQIVKGILEKHQYGTNCANRRGKLNL